MTGYRDVLKIAPGWLWDVEPDGRCWVVVDGDVEPVAATAVGPTIPPVGARVWCASTYDRLLILGADAASTPQHVPDIPKLSRDADSSLRLDAQGMWKATAGGFGGKVSVMADAQGWASVSWPPMVKAPAAVLVGLADGHWMPDHSPYVSNGDGYAANKKPAPTVSTAWVGGLHPSVTVSLAVWVVAEQAALSSTPPAATPHGRP